MTKKILYFGLSLVLVAALMLSACSKTTTTSATMSTSTSVTTSTPTKMSTTITTSAAPTTSKTSTTSAGDPVYGGKLTLIHTQSLSDPPSWDIHLSPRAGITTLWDNPYIEWMAGGDIEKYGPRGSNQFNFQLTTTMPSQYMKGILATSWEFSASPLSLTIHLRPGVMWTGNAKIGMAPREVTSADAVFSGTRLITAPNNVAGYAYVTDIVAVDKYTFRWDFNTYNANWEFTYLYGGNPSCLFAPESAAAGGSDWRNQTGTGPFILTDYVSGSAATFSRNPNYWGKTTINGKEYQMPFIDTLLYPVIADQSTELAALRTGKIDWWPRVPLSNSATLAQTSPKLAQQKWISAQVNVWYMNRLDGDPALSNLSVRQALMMATDFNTVTKLVWGEGNILGWPVSQASPSYTPVNQLPQFIQDQFTYNPTKAQQLLIAAGYPNLTLPIYYNAADPIGANCATVVSAEWAKVGVTLKLMPTENTALTQIKNSRSYKGLMTWTIGTANALNDNTWVQGIFLGGIYKTGEPLDVESLAAQAIIDPVQRQAALTKLCVDILGDTGWIPFCDPYILNCYWPWLKNYYGEIDAGYNTQIPMISRIWIDQNLKKSLGY